MREAEDESESDSDDDEEPAPTLYFFDLGNSESPDSDKDDPRLDSAFLFKKFPPNPNPFPNSTAHRHGFSEVSQAAPNLVARMIGPDCDKAPIDKAVCLEGRTSSYTCLPHLQLPDSPHPLSSLTSSH